MHSNSPPAGPGPDTSLRILILYAQPVFWSMGEGCGAVIFTALPSALAQRGHDVRVCLPAIGTSAGPGSQGGEGTFGSGDARFGSDDAGFGRGDARFDSGSRTFGGDASFGSGGASVDVYHGFHLHRFPASRSFVPVTPPGALARLTERTRQWLRYQNWSWRHARPLALSFRPHLVIGMGYYEAPAARRLARRLGVPNVTRVFGNSLSLTLARPSRFYANFPEWAGLRTPAAAIILNDDGADGLSVIRRLRIDPRPVYHLRNGLDFERFHPGPRSSRLRDSLDVRPEQPLLMTATRLATEKKLERSIAVLRDLRRFRPEARLAILGGGPEESRLREYALRQGQAEAVRFPGPVRHDELPDWYRSADVVLSLLDRTNAANPVFEAMACARPVVALDTGTSRRVVRDGETGLLFAPDQIEAIGPDLAALVDQPERMQAMGEAGRRWIPRLVLPMRERLAFEVDVLERAARS